jgi:membrane associated rhomboid family serine protease
MLPIGSDDSQMRSPPVVTYVLIAANVLVFIGLQKFGLDQVFTYSWSLVPYEFLSGHDLVTERGYLIDLTNREVVGELGYDIHLGRTPQPVYLTVVSSLFLHGNLLHLLGNMLFLWVFGKGVEDALGGVRFLIFYLVAGVSASLIHVLFNQSGMGLIVPCLGASGAISGVMGGFLMLFPHRRIVAVIMFVAMELPAFIVIGMWFLFQVINGVGMLGDPTGGGIAYSAHIGGFLVGLALIVPFAMGREHEDPYWRYRRM